MEVDRIVVEVPPGPPPGPLEPEQAEEPQRPAEPKEPTEAPTPPRERPESPERDYDDPDEKIEELQGQVASMRAQLDPVLHFRRRFGYGLIAATFIAATILVVATLVQMPSLDAAWRQAPVNTEALVLLAFAHVGVTAAERSGAPEGSAPGRPFCRSRPPEPVRRANLGRDQVDVDRPLHRSEVGLSRLRGSLPRFPHVPGRSLPATGPEPGTTLRCVALAGRPK